MRKAAERAASVLSVAEPAQSSDPAETEQTTESDGPVRVVGSTSEAQTASPVGDDALLSEAEERELYRYYSVPVEGGATGVSGADITVVEAKRLSTSVRHKGQAVTVFIEGSDAQPWLAYFKSLTDQDSENAASAHDRNLAVYLTYVASHDRRQRGVAADEITETADKR
jgi:hypothetical protein